MIELYFSNEEMKKFLEKEGYIVEKVPVWENYSEYHNRVVTEMDEIEIAYKNKPNLEEDNNRSSLLNKYGIKRLFTQKIKEKLLTL